MQIYRHKADLILREFIDADLPSLRSLRSDRETQFNLMTAQSLSDWDEEANSWAKSMVAGHYTGLRGAFDVPQARTDSFIGYWQLIPKDNFTLVGLALLPGSRGKGYGKSGFALLNEYAADIGIVPLHLEVLESNSPAIYIYLECGYKVISSAKKIVYGQPRNVLTMSSQ